MIIVRVEVVKNIKNVVVDLHKTNLQLKLVWFNKLIFKTFVILMYL